MPSSGTSLVGFMPYDQALHHLKTACVPEEPVDVAALEAQWKIAQERLGPPIDGAGFPDIRDLPADQQVHVNLLAQRDWYQRNAANWFPNSTFAMVEIEKLLAYQFTVDFDRSQHHCSGLSVPPTAPELLMLAWPFDLPAEQWDATLGPQSLIIRSRSMNVRALAQGMFPNPDGTLAGLYFGSSAPLVHVVRLDGRCYLHNGFHRVLGARAAGATHIPCVLRDVENAAQAAIQPPNTFSLELLQSDNPPTVAHFTQGRGLPVQLRAISRVLHVSWADYGLPLE